MGKRPSARSYHWGEELENELLEEAMKLIEPTGMSTLSTREVARMVGVSHAAPAHYFPGKITLAAALAAKGFERLHRAIQESITKAGDDASEEVIAASRAYVSFATRHPGLYRTMYAPELAEVLKTWRSTEGKSREHFENMSQQRRRVFELFIGIVEQGQLQGRFVSGPPGDIARVVTAVCYGMARDYLDGGLMFSGDRESYVRQTVRVILQGLEKR